MKRKLQIDYLKGLAIISVIFIHSTTIRQKDIIGAPYYILQAVPVFLALFGYNTIQSYLNRGISDLKSCYEKSYLVKRIKRILVPFIYIWILQLFALIIKGKPTTINDIIYRFLIGGWGPGGYFVPVVLQSILIIPLLYKASQYNKYIMLISAFTINMIFELFSYYINISGSIYEVVSLRYLFVIALGVYLALYEIKSWKLFSVGVLFSLIYITSINYFGLNLPVYHAWKSQNAPSFMYPFALMIFGLKKLPSHSKNFMGRILAIIGKRSYHIFLCQAFYFMFLNMFTHVMPHLDVHFAVPVNIFMCVILGITFYYCENKLNNLLKI